MYRYTDPLIKCFELHLDRYICTHNTYVNIYIYRHICIYVCMYIWVYMYICIYVYMYICMYIYMYICMFIDTCI